MLTEPRGPREKLWRLASSQRGYFSAAQAIAAGYSYQAQHFHVQRGNWIRIDRGIYRFREFLDLPGRGDDGLVRWSLWSKGRAVVSHASALAVHRLGAADPSEIHLTVSSGFRQRDPSVVLHRAELRADDVDEREGFRVTTPTRAIAESAADGIVQDIIDSAVRTLLTHDAATEGPLLRAAQRLGPRAELGIERALHHLRAQTITTETDH